MVVQPPECARSPHWAQSPIPGTTRGPASTGQPEHGVHSDVKPGARSPWLTPARSRPAGGWGLNCAYNRAAQSPPRRCARPAPGGGPEIHFSLTTRQTLPVTLTADCGGQVCRDAWADGGALPRGHTDRGPLAPKGPAAGAGWWTTVALRVQRVLQLQSRCTEAGHQGLRSGPGSPPLKDANASGVSSRLCPLRAPHRASRRERRNRASPAGRSSPGLLLLDPETIT